MLKAILGRRHGHAVWDDKGVRKRQAFSAPSLSGEINQKDGFNECSCIGAFLRQCLTSGRVQAAQHPV